MLFRSAAPYESGDFETQEGRVFVGSHVDAVGKRRVTVVYDAADTMMVEALAKARGIKPSAIYREALGDYLSKAI